MYTLDLTVRYSPFPISIQRKEFEDIVQIFNDIKNVMKENGHNSSLIELECEKMKDKSVAVISKEIIAVQIYEKSATAGGSKRPGFSLNG